MLLLNIVMSKKDDDSKMMPSKAFLSKTRAMAYIEERKAEEPTTEFEIDTVNFEDIEDMKVWLVDAHECCCEGIDPLYPDMVFYEKILAESAPKLMEYPENTTIREYTLRGPKFMDAYMKEHGIKFYIHYQVLFTENGEVDTSNPKSNTVEEYFTEDIGIVIGEPIIENDDPEHLWVSIFYTLKDPIHKNDLLTMAKKARTDYIHDKYDLEY